MYIKQKLKALLLAALLTGLLAPLAQAASVEAVLFTSPYCPHCRDLKRSGFMEEFIRRHPDGVRVIEYDVTKDANNILFFQTIRAYGQDSAGIPALVVGESFLQGYPDEIGTRADLAVQKALMYAEKTRVTHPAAPKTEPKPVTPLETDAQNAPEAKNTATTKSARTSLTAGQPAAQPRPSDQADGTNAPTAGREPAENRTASEEGAATEAASFLQAHKNMFGQITVWAILGAGLADGINPCAFAVIVFFVSFLAAYKYNRKEVLIVGAAYCLAVFLAYVLLGLGLFKFLYAMKGFQYVTLLVQWGTVALCALLFLLSLYDFIIYTRTKKSEKLLLQLPKSYKEYIHKVMRFFLKDKHGSVWRLTLAAFIVGFVVSAVEAVCTGQVYLPTIVVILKEADRHFWRAAEYLLLYNLMFIVPLVIVFALTLCGKESASLNGWLKRHLGLTKLILCGVFLALLLILLSTLF